MKYLALLLLAAGWANGCADAQGLTLSPVLLSAPADGGATSLTVSSGLSETRLVQVRVFDWTQVDGGEQMVAAREVRFGPEIFEIAPGRSQTVRFVLPDTDGKGAWRVVVDELPPEDDGTGVGAVQLSLRLRYVLSMFAAPPGAPGQLAVSAGADGVELRNTGQGWLKMHNLSLVSADGAAEPAAPGIVYLLPGAMTRLAPPADLARFESLSYAVGESTYVLDLRPGQ